LTEEMAAQADAVAEQSAAVLRATEKEIVQMMAQSEREGGVTAEHTAAIIDACGEAASLRGWSSAVRASLTERAAQCGEKQQVDLKQVRSEFIVTTSAMRESMKEMLKERTEEGFDEKLAVFDSKRRLAEASRAKLTQALISSRTQAYVTPVEQMVGFVEAQKEFFRQGLAAMEALQPSVDALRERAAAAEAEAEATGQSLTALMERLQQIDESDEPVFEPVPDGRVLKAGISLLGKHLGPPQVGRPQLPMTRRARNFLASVGGDGPHGASLTAVFRWRSTRASCTRAGSGAGVCWSMASSTSMRMTGWRRR
jgi:hypothetical protein